MWMIEDEAINAVWPDVAKELERTKDRTLPDDPLRCAALLCEEAGEAMTEALDLTRTSPPTEWEQKMGRVMPDLDMIKQRLYTETVHAACIALRSLAQMKKDGVVNR